MKCYNCPKPALYRVGDESGAPFCLDCYYKWSEIQNIHFLQNAAMANQALDDMEVAMGMRIHEGRIPIAALAAATMKGDRTVYNNINVTNSTVCAISTGDLAKIDAVITLTKGSDAEEIGKLLKELTQTILDSNQVQVSTKKDTVELIKTLSEQIAGERKQPVIKALLRGLGEIVRTGGVALEIYEKLESTIQTFLKSFGDA